MQPKLNQTLRGVLRRAPVEQVRDANAAGAGFLVSPGMDAQASRRPTQTIRRQFNRL